MKEDEKEISDSLLKLIENNPQMKNLHNMTTYELFMLVQWFLETEKKRK